MIVEPVDGDIPATAATLIAAAGGDGSKVRLRTDGDHPIFDVDDDVVVDKPQRKRRRTTDNTES